MAMVIIGKQSRTYFPKIIIKSYHHSFLNQGQTQRIPHLKSWIFPYLNKSTISDRLSYVTKNKWKIKVYNFYKMGYIRQWERQWEKYKVKYNAFTKLKSLLQLILQWHKSMLAMRLNSVINIIICNDLLQVYLHYKNPYSLHK